MVSSFPGWTDQTVCDESVLNLSGVISDIGDALFNLDRSKYKLLVCIQDGSGLKINHVYLCPANPDDPLIDISDIGNHTHVDDSSGGSYFEIKRANPLFLDTGAYFLLNPDKALYTQVIGTGGSINNDTDGTTKEKSIKTATGATNGTVVDYYATGQKLDFAKRSMIQTAIKFGTATSIAFGFGPNADSLSITATATQKYNLEVCTATGANWIARSADGSDKVAEDTGYVFNTSKIALKIEHFPDLSPKKIDYYIGNNAVWSKTTRIPNNGVTAADNLFKTTFKNNTPADRTLFQYGSRLQYYISDVWQ